MTQADSSVVYEYRRWVDDEAGVVVSTSESGPIAAVATPTLEEALGVSDPGDATTTRYAFAAWSRQTAEEGLRESGYDVYAYAPASLTLEERVAVYDARRPEFGDAAMDQEISYVTGGRPATPEPVIDATSEAHLGLYADGTDVPVRCCGAHAPEYHLPEHALFYELAYGWDAAARAAAIDALRADRAAIAATMQTDLVAAVASAGGTVVSTSDRDNCIWAHVPKAAVTALAAIPAVRSLLVRHESLESGGAESDGTSGNYGMQVWQFWQAAQIGETPSTRNSFGDITAAIVDRGFQDFHLVLKDAASDPSYTRVKQRWDCDAPACNCSDAPSGCTGVSDLPWVREASAGADDHGTKLFSVLMGDLTDNQDPAITGAAQQQYSGYAGEAGIALLLHHGGCCEQKGAVNRTATSNVDVLSLSVAQGDDCTACCGGTATIFTVEPGCRGSETNGFNYEVNNAFKDGTLVVKAAGNRGNASCCTVTAPGDAVGSFTVGGTMNACSSDHNAVRTADIYTLSSVGGGEIGRPGTRTIVDIVTPAQRQFRASCSGSSCANNEYDTACGSGTSWSAPAAAAAAVDFKDHWISEHTPASLLDNAHYFRTAMLLMGDRWDGTSKRTFGFRKRWGAGRLKMRQWNSSGMDGPWGDELGFVTINDGDVYTRWLMNDTPTPLAADVDALRVVIWWYEPMTETTAADIVLRVKRYDSTCTTYETAYLDQTYDTKKMIALVDLEGGGGDPGGKCWKMEIQGYNVTPNDEDGNLPRRRVYWAYYYEDTDRDDPGGPYLTCLDPPACTQVNPGDVELP